MIQSLYHHDVWFENPLQKMNFFGKCLNKAVKIFLKILAVGAQQMINYYLIHLKVICS